MAAPASPRSRTSTEPRERRRRESVSPLALPATVVAAAVAEPPPAPAEPAFHDIEEAFFRAGAEDTLQRNEGDEYELEPGLLQRVFRR